MCRFIFSPCRVWVVWHEENLEFLEFSKTPEQKSSTEPKSPYYSLNTIGTCSCTFGASSFYYVLYAMFLQVMIESLCIFKMVMEFLPILVKVYPRISAVVVPVFWLFLSKCRIWGAVMVSPATSGEELEIPIKAALHADSVRHALFEVASNSKACCQSWQNSVSWTSGNDGFDDMDQEGVVWLSCCIGLASDSHESLNHLMLGSSIFEQKTFEGLEGTAWFHDGLCENGIATDKFVWNESA